MTVCKTASFFRDRGLLCLVRLRRGLVISAIVSRNIVQVGFFLAWGFCHFPFQLFLLFFLERCFCGWILAESAEEIADDKSSQAVEEKNLAHEPEVDWWHLQVAVVGLWFEVCSLGPSKYDEIKNNEGHKDRVDAVFLLEAAESHWTEDEVEDVHDEEHPADHGHWLALLVGQGRLILILSQNQNCSDRHCNGSCNIEKVEPDPEALISHGESNVLVGQSSFFSNTLVIFWAIQP